MEFITFESDMYGKIRVMCIDDEIYFVAKTIAFKIGYMRDNFKIGDYCTKYREMVDSKTNLVYTMIPCSDVFKLFNHAPDFKLAVALHIWLCENVMQNLKDEPYVRYNHFRKDLHDFPLYGSRFLKAIRLHNKNKKKQSEAKKDYYSTTDMAKLLKMQRADELNITLDKMGIHTRNRDDGIWYFVDEYKDCDYDNVIDVDDKNKKYKYRAFTEKGKDFILSLFKNT